ncbi:MAG: amino acid-binding ACT domain protein [Corynebacterium sp.]|nr:amino acid-binding ACT domain protein [Corynebacterium sp.]
MSYLLRVLLPDTPGSLGRVAEAIGIVNGDIMSVDVVEAFPDGTVMDDMVVSLPHGVMADELITAAHEVPGVEVDSIRPFTGRVDRRGQIAMLASVADAPSSSEAVASLVNAMPKALTSTWVVLLDLNGGRPTRIAASGAAPEAVADEDMIIPVHEARILNPEEEDWIPASWSLLDSSLAASPLGDTGLLFIVGRVGGPDFLATEVVHLGNLGSILSKILRSPKSRT